MIKIICKIPLLNDPKSSYTGAEFCQNKYRILQPTDEQAIEYDISNKKIGRVDVTAPYSSITRDRMNSIFYMASLNNKHNLYSTTNKYEEIDSFELKIPKEYVDDIHSISFDNKLEKIVIVTARKVYSVDVSGNFITSEISTNSTNALLEIRSVPTNQNHCGCSNGLPKLNMKKNYFSSARYFCGNKYIAYVKDNSSYLANISPNGNIIANYYIDDDIVINSMFSVNGCLQLLVTKNKKYNYIYMTDFICCKEKGNEQCDDLCEDESDECSCLQNEEYLEVYDKGENNCEYIEIKNKCKEQCDVDCSLIESIALVETGISHILNAEGEKIQKAISISKDTCELLEVNNSVNQIIKSITFLEHILYNKLELSKKCETCEKEDDDCL